jgi:hypothetical protein
MLTRGAQMQNEAISREQAILRAVHAKLASD